MKRLIIAGAAAATLLATAGCAGSRPSGGPGGPGRPGDPASYLAVSNSKVAFIQWRATSRGRLQGTITEGNVGASAAADTLSVSSAPFTGTRSGSSVRLTFAGSYFLQTRALGSLNGSTLTVQVPQSDGTIRQARFSQSDEASYNRAIAKLRSTIRRDDLAAGGDRPADAQAAQRALSVLYSDSSLGSGGRLAGGLARFADSIHIAQSDLAAEQRDASGSNGYCVAAYRAVGKAQTVDGDLLAVQGDVQSMVADTSIVRDDIAIADAHLRHLNKAGLTAPSSAYVVIANAKVSLTQAIAKANSYIGQMNAIDAEAHSIANHMAARSCSKARSGATTRPLSPIR